MKAIQKLLPNPHHTEVQRIFVKAKPEEAWRCIRHFDGGSIPWIHFLFDLRDLPNRLRGKENIEDDFRLSVNEVTASGKGFMILFEEGFEVVVGSVGQFWHLNIPFAHLTKNEFTDFNTPGWGKLAWAISVEPYQDGSTVSLELRTTATDEDSWNKLERYYRLIGIGSRLIRKSVMSQVEAELGKLKRDYDVVLLPGDNIIPDARHSITQYIDIEAPTSTVWRYLMQMGCDRAGWYSIDALDNAGVPSADFLVNGWSTRSVGDKISTTPKHDGFFEVYDIDIEKSFIIGSETERLNDPFKSTWSFVLSPIGNDASTLIVRARMKSSPRWKEWLLGSVILPPVHLLMQTAQLRNLRHISERDARSSKKVITHVN